MYTTIWPEYNTINEKTRKLFEDETFIVVFICGIILVVIACIVLIGCTIHCIQKPKSYRLIADNTASKKKQDEGTEIVSTHSYSQVQTSEANDVEEQEEEEEEEKVIDVDEVDATTDSVEEVTTCKATAIGIIMKGFIPLSGTKLLSGSHFHLFVNHII